MRKTHGLGLMLLVATILAPLAHVHSQQAGAERAIPRLSGPLYQYYQQHPDELQQWIESLPPVSHEIVPGQQLAPGEPPVGGSWTSLTNPSGQNLSNPILMTDGTLIAHVTCTSNWFKFTPDNTGNYINGTWSAIASTASTYAPRFFGSGVLPDGRVIIMGGEYNGANCPNNSRTTQGAIYDPLANTWTPITPPAGWGTVSDAAGIVLPDGTYMQTSCCDNPPHAALRNVSTATWAATGTGKFDPYDEEAMALLHDGTILTVDAYTQTGTCGTGSERYDPATGAWTSAGSTIIQQADCNGKQSFEVGPLVMRPDGTAVSFSGRTSSTPQTAFYNTSTHVWSAGTVHPSISALPYTMADAPAAVLPNGNVLVAMSPSNWAAVNSFPSPTHFWELNIADNTFTQVADKADSATWNSFEANFLLLPTGQVMAFTVDGPTVQIYTPAGTFQNAWRPVVSSVPTTLTPNVTFSISGTQLNGLTEGTYYGDDTDASTNFPLVRITNTASGHVFYGRTFGHSSRSIAPGAASSTSVTLPGSVENGASTLEVVANGIPSLPVNVTVGASVAADLTTPTPGSTLTGSTVTFGWNSGTGVSQYYLYVGTTGVGSNNIYSASTGTTQSATVSTLPASGTIYVRLWSLLPTGWAFHDYTYTEGVPLAAVITTPPPGSTLGGSTVTFGWNSGNAVSQDWLYVGTTGTGSANIYSASAGTTQSATVSSLPTSGIIYVRLWSLLPTGWAFHDYTYTGGVPVAAAMTTPIPGSTLAGPTVTFGWNSGAGVSQYYLYVGTTGVGSNNIYSASTGTTQSATVGSLPASGTIYVRLWSLLSTGWTFRDYTYTGGLPVAAAITTPIPGSTLAGPTVTFGWNSGAGVSQYYLYVGTTGVGSANIYAASTGTTQSATVSSLPATGTVYVRLWSLVATGWVFRDYTYAGGVGVAAALTTPLPGSTLSGPTVTFGWNSGAGVSQYYLYVGTTGVDSANVYAASTGTTQSATVSSLPATGTVYVRLWSLLSTGWTFQDSTYTGGAAAAMTTPIPGSTLSSSTVTFGWNPGTGVTQYWLYIGTTGVDSADVYNQSAGTTQSATVSGVPTSGTVYVRLWSFAGAWQFNDYTYTGGGAAAITTPAPDSTLSGSTVTFGWNSGTGVSQYWLYVGTTGAGSLDVYNQSAGTRRSATASGLPESKTIYVRLWSLVTSGWVFNDYTYTGGGAAAITTPAPFSTLSGSTVTFGWNSGSGVSQYWLDVGTTGTGSSNVYSQTTGTTQSAVVSGLPTSGTINVRVWSLLASGWEFNDYTYSGGT